MYHLKEINAELLKEHELIHVLWLPLVTNLYRHSSSEHKYWLLYV